MMYCEIDVHNHANNSWTQRAFRQKDLHSGFDAIITDDGMEDEDEESVPTSPTFRSSI